MIRELKLSIVLFNYFCIKDGVYIFFIQKEEGMYMVWMIYWKLGIENF